MGLLYQGRLWQSTLQTKEWVKDNAEAASALVQHMRSFRGARLGQGETTSAADGFSLSLNVGQATKGPRWMPWRQEPMKGAVRLRKASVSRLTGLAVDSRMGKPLPQKAGDSWLNI